MPVEPAPFIQVWRLQWAQPRDLEPWQRRGVPYMTSERLTSLVNEALKAGFAQGELQGRVNLRTDIEDGAVPPIQRRVDVTD